MAGATVWALDDADVLRGYRLATARLLDRVALGGVGALVDSPQDVSLVAADGLLLVPAGGEIVALRSATPPPRAGGVRIRLRFTDLSLGRTTRVDGRAGPAVVGRKLRLEADPYPYGRWRRAGTTAADPADGTFRITVKPRRNTRYRVRVVGGDP